MREKFQWNVEMQAENGEVVNYPIACYWDPSLEDAEEAVLRAAQAEAFVKSGKTTRYFPLKAERA